MSPRNYAKEHDCQTCVVNGQYTRQAVVEKRPSCSTVGIIANIADRSAELCLCEAAANCRLTELGERRRGDTFVPKRPSKPISLVESSPHCENDVIITTNELNIVGTITRLSVVHVINYGFTC